jgi:deoxyribodipyrimidine photo-lyase
MITNLYWFRNDLRVDDNQALSLCIQNSDYVVPIYIIDTSDLGMDRWGFPKIGIFRRKFIVESLLDLKKQLNERGSDLFIFIGNTIEIIQDLSKKYNCNTIYTTSEVTFEEQELEKKVSEIMNLVCVGHNTLYPIEDLPFSIDKLSKHFTGFREIIESKLHVQNCVSLPLKINLPDTLQSINNSDLGLFYSSDHFTYPEYNQIYGGKSSALKRVNDFFWNSKSLSTYKDTRNELKGEFYSSKLSPYLARGCISAGQVYWFIKQYEDEVERNESTYWLYFELLWREYFKLVSLQKGTKLFSRDGWAKHKPFFREDKEEFERWRLGKTNEPLINAFQKELMQTGFMSNRGRQIVASYLVKNLQLDWRMGAAWFDSTLVDLDVASNYGNWTYQAGVGNDPQKDRMFNLKIQTEKYDPKHHFIEFWNK